MSRYKTWKLIKSQDSCLPFTVVVGNCMFSVRKKQTAEPLCNTQTNAAQAGSVTVGACPAALLSSWECGSGNLIFTFITC